MMLGFNLTVIELVQGNFCNCCMYGHDLWRGDCLQKFLSIWNGLGWGYWYCLHVLTVYTYEYERERENHNCIVGL